MKETAVKIAREEAERFIKSCDEVLGHFLGYSLFPDGALWWLWIGHCVCDYPLQGEFLAKGKNHKNPIPGISWYHCLMAHAFIHAGAVTLITGSLTLGFAELVFHSIIDYGKSDGWFSYNTDQLLHMACKVVWAVCMGKI